MRMKLRLDTFAATGQQGFTRGRPAFVEALWFIAQWLLVSSFLPGSWHRVLVLRLFGARIGQGVVIKPRFRVKFPWRLDVGDHCWLGEDAWIDNLAQVSIGAHSVVSQSAYLCTGSHDWSRSDFALQCRPIELHEGSWVCARATLAPGTIVGEGTVVGLGAVASGKLLPWSLYRGNPARATGIPRVIHELSSSTAAARDL
jgi:putative colanic acid biosynthesis acetyltransferase WcaF